LQGLLFNFETLHTNVRFTGKLLGCLEKASGEDQFIK